MDIKLLLTLSDVVEIVSLSRATIYRRIKADKFPKPVQVSDYCVRWRRSDILTWVADPENWAPVPNTEIKHS
ncbi:MAG: AlpA family phage regulatory protein [Gammaproteobacteria bacterium]|nr:AlpA family phage regulatory protein [Gammaproteobacteria bacterium]MDH5651324.1 AlpA family phage regulatory protein [Gammaproteobacteria bacterium]